MMRSRDRGFVAVDGVPVLVQRNHDYADDDPVVLAAPGMFYPAGGDPTPPVVEPEPVASPEEPPADEALVVKDRRGTRGRRG
jgi:hypothetical protein